MTSSPRLPRLRRDLLFTPVREGQETLYVIEDPIRHLFYRVGREEYLLISGLNHFDSLDALLDRVAAESGTFFTAEQAQTIFAWLSSRQLLQAEDAGPLLGVVAQERAFQGVRRFSRLNLISFKLPLTNPDPLLRRCGFLSWLTGMPFFLLWLALSIAALSTLAAEWQAFTSQTAGFFGAENLMRIWLIWFGLKLVHELFHALVCYRYGGRIFEAGILFVLFIPLTYVNATSSWRFPSKWQRMHVAVAGIFIELGVAFAALLIWSWSPDSPAGYICHNTVIIAGVSSLLFNANPLMRFDGYYLLSDLTGLPNLYQQGLESIRSLFARFFLGLQTPEPPHRVFLIVYGVAIHIWRILVLVSLGYLASRLAGGLGIFLTLGAVLVWVGVPLHTFLKRWPGYRQRNPALVRQLAARLCLTLLLLIAALELVGWEKRIQAPAIVEYEQQYGVRNQPSGFVREIRVEDGDTITAGQILLVLDNSELEYSRRQLRLQLEQLDLKSRLAYSSGRIGDLQILRDQQSTLRNELKAVEDDIAALVIRAPGDGICIGENLSSLQDVYLPKGQELLWIVSLERKELIGMAAQNDIEQFHRLVSQPVEVDMRASGIGVFQGKLNRIAPRMLTVLSHPALGAVNGGPLDVRQTVIDAQGQGMEQQLRYELFTPRFTLHVDIPAEIRQQLSAGQLAILTIRGERASLGDTLWQAICTWIKKKRQE